MPGLKRPGSGRAFGLTRARSSSEELFGLLILGIGERVPWLINLAYPQQILILSR